MYKIDLNKYIAKFLLDSLLEDGRTVSLIVEKILATEYNINLNFNEVRFVSEKAGVSFLPSYQKGYGRVENIQAFKKKSSDFDYYWLIFKLPLSSSVLVFRLPSKVISSTEGKLSYKKCVILVRENSKEGKVWLH